MKWKTVATGVLILTTVAGFLARGDHPIGEPVAAALANPAVPDRQVAASGIVEPKSQARLLEASVIGRLVTMNFGDGDHVSAGAVIAEIENADLKAQLAAAEASLTARANELLRLTTGAREQEISAARAALHEAEAEATMARSNFNRQSTLGVKQIVSKEAVEQAQADRDVAEARRDLATQKLSLLISPPRAEDVAIAEANVRAAEATIANIKAEIEKTIIRSPIEGTVLKVYRQVGETVSNLPPTAIASVGDTDQLRIRADVNEEDVAEVAAGETVWVSADAFHDTRFRGTVTQLGAQLGRRTVRSDAPDERVDSKILEVFIDLDPDTHLPIGLPVDLKIDVSSKPQITSQALPSLAPPLLRPALP